MAELLWTSGVGAKREEGGERKREKNDGCLKITVLKEDHKNILYLIVYAIPDGTGWQVQWFDVRKVF